MLILIFDAAVPYFLCIFAKLIVEDNCLQRVEHDKETYNYMVYVGGGCRHGTGCADLSVGCLYNLFSQGGAVGRACYHCG
jgi:hypothetical protein